MCIGTLAIVGEAAGGLGQVAGGIAQANAASYQAQIARNNAITAQQNATYSASAGAAQAEQSGLKERAQLAQVRAAEGANGLDVDTGSPANVQTSQRELGTLDTQTVSNNAALQTYGYETQSTNFTAQAAMDQSEVGYDIAGGVLKGVGSVASNPSVDSAIGSSPSYSGASANLDDAYNFDPSAVPSTSLLSGSPSVGANYQWMLDN